MNAGRAMLPSVLTTAASMAVVGRGRDYGDVPPVKGVYAGPDATGNEVTVRVTRLR